MQGLYPYLKQIDQVPNNFEDHGIKLIYQGNYEPVIGFTKKNLSVKL